MSYLNLEYTLVQASEDITTGAASAQSTAAPVGTTHVRLSTTVACRVLVGGTNPTALATSELLPVGYVALKRIVPGDKVAAIQEGSAGKCNVAFVKVSRP